MRRGYAALALLALIWGASFLFIKLAVQDMSAATLVLGRVSPGSLSAPGLIGQRLSRSGLGTIAVAAAAVSSAVAALVQRCRLSGVSPFQIGFSQVTLSVPLARSVPLPPFSGTQLHHAS